MHWIRLSRHSEIRRSCAPLFNPPDGLRFPARFSPASRIWSKRKVFTQSKDDIPAEQHELDHEDDNPSSGIESNSSKQSIATITARERETFDRIFRSIVASASSVPGRRGDHIGPLKRKHKGEDLNGRLNFTLRKTEGEGNRQHDGLSANPGILEKTMDRELEEMNLRDVMRYPESLRAAAAETIRTVQRLSQAHSQPTKKPAQVEDSPHQKELDRVIKLMKGAKTDRELWSVLEYEVFSMIRQSNGEGGKTKVKSARRRRGQQSDAELVDDQEKSRSKDNQPPLTTIGPNYPYLLLLAMRIFRYDFQLPSACLSLFAQVRSLGPISYVLGATTPLYNEIIGLKWKSYGDFHGIDELLIEMEKSGVEFDEDTLLLLEGIEKERRLVMRGDEGNLMKDLWCLDGVRGGLRRIIVWKEIVDEKLTEKAIAIGRKE